MGARYGFVFFVLVGFTMFWLFLVFFFFIWLGLMRLCFCFCFRLFSQLCVFRRVLGIVCEWMSSLMGG